MTRFVSLIILVLVLLATFGPILSQKIQGLNYVGYYEGCFNSDTSDQLVKQLSSSTGANWISIVAYWVQDNITSTQIYYPSPNGPTKEDITHIVHYAHSLGLKVALKPHVNLAHDPTHWRGQIGQGFTETQWNHWFDSYNQYMKFMASTAEELGIDLLIIGTELSATESQEAHWRQVISSIRKKFYGAITYGANHGDIGWDNVKWWDAVDFIGLDAYYPISNSPSADVDQLVQGWQPWIKDIGRLAAEWNKTVIFTEVGYESRADTAMHPWESSGPLDLTAQQMCYEALFRAVNEQPWFSGSLWWAWSSNYQEGGDTDDGFSPRGKPAAQVLKKWWSSN